MFFPSPQHCSSNDERGCASGTRVEFERISKRFEKRIAVNDVSFEIAPGTVHAILGENGAGKSTLMKVLAGEIQPDSGRVVINGRELRLGSPREAKRQGIRFVHQHLSLVPALTVRENFVLDDSMSGRSHKAIASSKELTSAIEQFGINVDADQKVVDLSMGERQWLEVFRATFLGGRLIILDEPTALLSPVEGDRLLALARKLAREGRTVLMITHKLREIMEFADEVSVMRKGKHVGMVRIADTNVEELSKMMVESGEEVRARSVHAETVKLKPLLELRSIAAMNRQKTLVLKDLNLVLNGGEVHGVAGVAGNGQTELVEIVAQLRRADKGVIRFCEATGLRTRYVPAARTTEAISPQLSIFENLVLRDFNSNKRSTWGVIDWASLRSLANHMVKEFQIKVGDLDDSPRTLSGGNMQRIVLAREMGGSTDLLVVHNPTSGVDLSSSLFVRERLQEAARSGVGVLLVSDDLDELMHISDRISVLHLGTVVGELSREDFSRERIAGMMVGIERI